MSSVVEAKARCPVLPSNRNELTYSFNSEDPGGKMVG